MTANQLTPEDPPPFVESATAAFRQWEWLRVAYNVVLFLVLLPWFGPLIDDPKFTIFVIKSAIGANIAFCIGPVVEGYAVLLGIPRKVARYALFTGGMLLAMMIEVVSIITFFNPESF